ncbi:uncharacterized protein [Parasteatoda tepidariorum]|uniref:uncharacterized protein n=1 Tax=Parasteatoda tepidariorum TaxID=114398 RepID=UPI00077FC1B0|nr:uncharacterized protein LOC107454620 [Parasteatoda tepidariorum]
MWWFLIFLAAFAKGILIPGEESEISHCDKPLYRVCDVPLNEHFPRTPDEVDLLCRNLISYHNCASEFIESCDLDEEELPSKPVFKNGVLLNLCDKDSPIYGNLVNNADCIANTVDDLQKVGFCRRHLDVLELEQPDIHDQIDAIISRGEEEPYTQLSRCLDTFYGVGCFGTELNQNKCDESAFQLVLWFFEKSEISKRYCREEHEPIIREFVELLKFELKK